MVKPPRGSGWGSSAVRLVLMLLSLMQAAVYADVAVKGAGSTAAAAIYRGWAAEYQKDSGMSVAYDSVGSGAGVKKAIAREVDFGATDVSIPMSELASNGLLQIPIGVTGIVPVFNIPGGGTDAIRLSGEILSRIFLGEISHWNHEELVRLNPRLASIDLPIKVVVRSDGSGTTYNFSDYLSKVSPDWARRMGIKSSFAWPEHFVAAKGSEGVVKAVQQTRGSLGYVDFSYVKAAKLQAASVRNSEGEYPNPSSDSFRNALMHSDWNTHGTFTSALTNRPGKGVWPITMGTYVVVPRNYESGPQGARTINFIAWGFLHGDATVNANNFVRLPDRVQAAAFKVMASVKDMSGNVVPIRLQ